jgi:5,10-methylenetetrahydromethanopterin reductase
MDPTSRIPRVGILFRPQLPPERLREFVIAAEMAGLDDLWMWEDCFLEGGLTSAAVALAWSSSLRIGLGLMPAPLRNPALAAMEVATLARLFPGRFVPAVGHGVLPWMEQVGARALSPMTVSGQYVRLSDVALDWPPATVPPLLVGARGPKTLALAGELADGLVLDAGTSPPGVRQAVDRAAARRPHEVVVYVLCGAGVGSTERIEAELTKSSEPLSSRAAVGSPEEVAETVRSFTSAGATTVVLQPTAEDPDVAATIRLAAAAKTLLQNDRTVA